MPDHGRDFTLNERAELWAEKTAELVDLERKKTALENEINTARRTAEGHQSALGARVGSNIPRKLYKTSRGYVVVIHNTGIPATVELLHPEAEDR